MLILTCPNCGVTGEETEFHAEGEAHLKRYGPGSSDAEFHDYLFIRENPKGWHTEWWHHVAGCRQWVKVVRNTFTHEISSTGGPHEKLKLPSNSKKASAGGRGK